jgi:hypothetical protein
MGESQTLEGSASAAATLLGPCGDRAESLPYGVRHIRDIVGCHADPERKPQQPLADIVRHPERPMHSSLPQPCGRRVERDVVRDCVYTGVAQLLDEAVAVAARLQ